MSCFSMHSLIAYIFLAEVRSLLKSFSLRLQTFRTPCSSGVSSGYGARRDMVGGESRDAVATPAGFVLWRPLDHRAVPGAHGISTARRFICIGMKRVIIGPLAFPLLLSRRLAAHGKRTAIVLRPRFRCEVRRMKLGHHQARGRARLRMLLFAWIRF
jgi:hypothetical protein